MIPSDTTKTKIHPCHRIEGKSKKLTLVTVVTDTHGVTGSDIFKYRHYHFHSQQSQESPFPKSTGK